VIHGFVERRPQWTTVMGSGLVLAGLALFMVVFFTLFPILTNPVGAYDNWFPVEEPAAAAPVTVAPPAENPTARFTWEAVAVETVEPPVYRLRVQSTSIAGGSAIDVWQWDFSDGSVGAEIKSTIDTAVGSIGASARGGVVVFLFALAALATTIVAWRVARIGVVILNGTTHPHPKPPEPPRYDDYERARQLEVV